MTATRAMHRVPYQRAVSIDLAKVALNGDLGLPPHPSGIVLFAHGSGSSRFRRNTPSGLSAKRLKNC